MKFTAIVLSALILSGCLVLQDNTVDDVRQPENFYKEEQLQQTLLEIQKSLYTYSSKCRPAMELSIDPENSQKGTFVLFGVGNNNAQALSVLDFVENDVGITTVTAHALGKFARSMVDEFLGVISNPNICSKKPHRLGVAT